MINIPYPCNEIKYPSHNTNFKRYKADTKKLEITSQFWNEVKSLVIIAYDAKRQAHENGIQFDIGGVLCNGDSGSITICGTKHKFANNDIAEVSKCIEIIRGKLAEVGL